MTNIEKKSVRVALFGRDEVELDLELNAAGEILKSELRAVGCPKMMELVRTWRQLLSGSIAQISMPTENDHASILFRELLLRAQDNWHFPYEDVELCHCRAVPTQKVDDAIIAGAHTTLSVSRQTSASTSCGACRPDVEKILNFRLCRKKTGE